MALGGAVLMLLGLYFLFVRPPLLPEDLRAVGTTLAQRDAAIPGLARRLRHVFRQGVVTRSAGLLPSNHFLSVAIDELFRNRPQWSPSAAVGKTVVTSAMIDRVATRLGRVLFEVPVGFKWFSDGLGDGGLGFGNEESAGATFLRRDGRVWTTDKDGIASALLSAEMTARLRGDPGERYRALCAEFGEVFADRVEATITPDLKAKFARLAAT